MALKPGLYLDHFLIIQALGEGAFGAVYKVQDTRDGQLLAMKILKPSPEQSRYDPVKEARPLVAVQHPHIVGFRALHPLQDGTLALVMDFAQGESLDKFAARERDVEALLMLLNQVAMGLDYAHSKGVVHRDVKPANILVTFVDGQPSALVSDFGLGREVGFELHSTVAAPAGTLVFMAPEAFRVTEEVPASVDRWALAVTAFLLLADAFPFPHNNRGFPDHSRRNRLQSFVPRAPAALDTVFARAFDLVPHRRYGTCLEFTQSAGAAVGMRLPLEPGPARATTIESPRPPSVALPPAPDHLRITNDATFTFAVQALLSRMRQDLPERRENVREVVGIPLHWRVRAGHLVVGLPARNAFGRIGVSHVLVELGFTEPGPGEREWTLRIPVGGDLSGVAERVLLGLAHGYGIKSTDMAMAL